MKNIILFLIILSMSLSSCVSKKKYTALETEYNSTKAELGQLTKDNIELNTKFDKIRKRVEEYNSKINSLNETNTSLNQSITNLNNDKLVVVNDNTVVMSKNVKDKLSRTLSEMNEADLLGAKTLKDSINLAISYNLRNSIVTNDSDVDNAIDVKIDKTVVMISVSDKMLFNSGSYKISSKANSILQKLADIINSEPSMDVIIEGHTDSKSIKTTLILDNWDLSVKRATSIVRVLQNKYNVDPSRLIASGRSSYVPISNNETKEGRAKNRRTNIIILPNINKFFALLAKDEKIEIN